MNRSFCIAGLAFGDEGKGCITDFVARQFGADVVVRTGGPQAAHNVVTPEGIHHTFSQFGSATLAGVPTFLSREMMVDPMALYREAEVLASKGVGRPFDMITIDGGSTIVTPFHSLANRIREIARGDNRHGSVGRGIGEAREDSIAGYSLTPDTFSVDLFRAMHHRKLEQIRPIASAAPDLFRTLAAIDIDLVHAKISRILHLVTQSTWRQVAARAKCVVFENSQGVLLDERYGFAPYHTWSDCTFGSAERLIEETGETPVTTRIGVLRTYYTRHGAGPFPTEQDPAWGPPEEHNGPHAFMGAFRKGNFDCQLARYAIECCGGVDGIAITHMDCIPSNLAAVDYDNWRGQFTAASISQVQPRLEPVDFAGISNILSVPTVIRSWGLSAEKIQMCSDLVGANQ